MGLRVRTLQAGCRRMHPSWGDAACTPGRAETGKGTLLVPAFARRRLHPHTVLWAGQQVWYPDQVRQGWLRTRET